MGIPLKLTKVITQLDPAGTGQSKAKQPSGLDTVVQSRHENQVKQLKVNQTVQVYNLMETK